MKPVKHRPWRSAGSRRPSVPLRVALIAVPGGRREDTPRGAAAHYPIGQSGPGGGTQSSPVPRLDNIDLGPAFRAGCESGMQ